MQMRFSRGDLIADRYLVLQKKTGGMADVYLTFDFSPTEMCCRALKLPKSSLEWSEDALSSLRREAGTWVSFARHPNITRCFLADVFKSTPYLLLEWVCDDDSQTHSVREIAQDGPTHPNYALRVCSDVLAALVYCAGVHPGFAHGDLKPENLLIGPENTIKVTDFGLARTSFSQPVRDGLWGSPAYMAPELWEGVPADAQSDIYAIGCILYELIEGCHPFDITTAQSARRAHLAARVKPFVLMNAQCHKLVQRCLARDRKLRPAGYDELAGELAVVGGQQRPRSNAAPLSATEFGNMALTYMQSGMFDEAFRAFSRALELDPKLARAYNNRANLNFELKRHEDALRDWTSAIEIDPEFVEAYHGRAQCHLQMGHLERALADATRAVQLSPNYSVALGTLGTVLMESNQFDKAGTTLKRALEIDPLDKRARFVLAEVYRMSGSFDLAEEQFSILEKDAGTDPKLSMIYLLSIRLCWIGAGYSRKAFADLDGVGQATAEGAMFLGHFFSTKNEPSAALRYYLAAQRMGQTQAEPLVRQMLEEIAKENDAYSWKYTNYRNWTDNPDALLNALAARLLGIFDRAELPNLLDRFVEASSIQHPELCARLGSPEFRDAMLEVVVPEMEEGMRNATIMKLALFASAAEKGL